MPVLLSGSVKNAGGSGTDDDDVQLLQLLLFQLLLLLLLLRCSRRPVLSRYYFLAISSLHSYTNISSTSKHSKQFSSKLQQNHRLFHYHTSMYGVHEGGVPRSAEKQK
jgi:hypothetical protein